MSERLITEERRQKLHALVLQKGTVSLVELAELLDVSRMTVYRDIKVLEDMGKLRHVRGGAASTQPNSEEPRFITKREVNSDLKDAIAHYAVKQFVNPGDIIILGAGTTAAAMLTHLQHQHVTLITNGLETINIATSLLNEATIMLCGGILREPARTLVGPQAEAFFAGINAQTMFFSASGLMLPEGISDPNPLEIQVKRAMAACAERCVLLLDSSKFETRSLAQVLPLHSIDVLITDVAAPEDVLRHLRSEGIDVHII